MTIDREFIEGSLQNVRKQREDALALTRRCEGAIEVFEGMLKRLDEPEPELQPTAE